jgi:hypothetical protein
VQPPESGRIRWRGRAPSARTVRHAWLTGQIQAVHLASRGIYGARRVHAELTMGLGITVGHGALEMLMRRAGIKLDSVGNLGVRSTAAMSGAVLRGYMSSARPLRSA